jgi:O-methyltransferase
LRQDGGRRYLRHDRHGSIFLSSIIFYRRRPVQIWADGGALCLRLAGAERVLRLEGTARRIWELLEYPAKTDEISDRLAAEFSGVTDDIAADVAEFVGSLFGKGAVEECAAPSVSERQRSRYLYLLKRALLNLIYPEHELRIRHLREAFRDSGKAGTDKLEETRFLRDIRYRQPDAFRALLDAKVDFASGLVARIPLCFPHTLIGLSGLDNLERCAERVFAEAIPGDFMEAGVCQGGAAIFLRALQVAFGQAKRRLWVADSFKGLPASQAEADLDSGRDFTERSAPLMAFSLEGVRDHFIRYDLLNEGVSFLPGWFAETFPDAPIGPLAILRIDADLYVSTREALENLHDRVSPGGFIIVDDYGAHSPCRQAVDEFRAERDIREPLLYADRSIVYWRKADSR